MTGELSMKKLANWGPWSKLGYFLAASTAFSFIVFVPPCVITAGCGINGGDILQATVTTISAIIGASVIGWQVRVGIESNVYLQRSEHKMRLKDELLPHLAKVKEAMQWAKLIIALAGQHQPDSPGKEGLLDKTWLGPMKDDIGELTGMLERTENEALQYLWRRIRADQEDIRDTIEFEPFDRQMKELYQFAANCELFLSEFERTFE